MVGSPVGHPGSRRRNCALRQRYIYSIDRIAVIDCTVTVGVDMGPDKRGIAAVCPS